MPKTIIKLLIVGQIGAEGAENFGPIIGGKAEEEKTGGPARGLKKIINSLAWLPGTPPTRPGRAGPRSAPHGRPDPAPRAGSRPVVFPGAKLIQPVGNGAPTGIRQQFFFQRFQMLNRGWPRGWSGWDVTRCRSISETDLTVYRRSRRMQCSPPLQAGQGDQIQHWLHVAAKCQYLSR